MNALPITRELTLAYRISFVVAVLIAFVSVAGLETAFGYTVLSRKRHVRMALRCRGHVLRYAIPDAVLDDWFCCWSDGQEAP